MSNPTPLKSTQIAVEISASRRFAGLNRRRLLRDARRACCALGLSSGELSIRLAGDEEMSRLHRAHKGVSGPTDVLTFDFAAPRPRDAQPGPQSRVEAEIVIGAQVAQREARTRGDQPHREAMLYIVHGLLHCLGFDDHRATDAAAMHLREDAVLEAIGVGRVFDRGGRRVGAPQRL